MVPPKLDMRFCMDPPKLGIWFRIWSHLMFKTLFAPRIFNQLLLLNFPLLLSKESNNNPISN